MSSQNPRQTSATSTDTESDNVSEDNKNNVANNNPINVGNQYTFIFIEGDGTSQRSIPLITQIPSSTSSSMNPNQFQLNTITDAVADAFLTLDQTYEDPGRVDDIVPHPHRDVFSQIFYHAACENDLVNELTNNVPISSVIAIRIFTLMNHFGLGGQSSNDETLPDNIDSPIPASSRSFAGLRLMWNNVKKLVSTESLSDVIQDIDLKRKQSIVENLILPVTPNLRITPQHPKPPNHIS